MARRLAIRQLLDCSEQDFWERIFGSEDFNRYLYEGLGFDYELQEWNPERIHANGMVVVEAVSEHQCERKVTVDIDAEVLGIGRLIETYLVASTREQYAKNAALVNEYLAERR